MALEIKWEPRARKDLRKIYEYLAQNYTDREINHFFAKLNKVLSLIASFPLMYSQTAKNRTVRRCVLSKQTSFVYKVKKDCIEILFMFDNRQNPDAVKI